MTVGTDPSYDALMQHHQRVQGMIEDPECTDELFALGVALARWIDFETVPGQPVKGKMLKIARGAISPSRIGKLGYAVEKIIREDIRRYDAQKDPLNTKHFWSIPCGAPMIRRSGTCGQHSTDRQLLVDHDTGRRQWHGACSRREHKQWLDKLWQQNRRYQRPDAADQLKPPDPAANAGGVLARHLPEIDWPALYLLVDPRWTPPPEETPWRPPTLSLLVSDSDLPPESDDAPSRPALAVLPGTGEGIRLE